VVQIHKPSREVNNPVYADVAQLEEHTLGMGKVTGSNPVFGSMEFCCQYVSPTKIERQNAGMAELVDALVLNTSGQ
jgi:hypothetical protein